MLDSVLRSIPIPASHSERLPIGLGLLRHLQRRLARRCAAPARPAARAASGHAAAAPLITLMKSRRLMQPLEPEMQNEQYHTTLWRVGSRKGAQGGILDGWLDKVRGRFPKAVARSFRGRVYSPRFNMSGNLAMLDATRLASSIVICFASIGLGLGRTAVDICHGKTVCVPYYVAAGKFSARHGGGRWRVIQPRLARSRLWRAHRYRARPARRTMDRRLPVSRRSRAAVRIMR